MIIFNETRHRGPSDVLYISFYAIIRAGVLLFTSSREVHVVDPQTYLGLSIQGFQILGVF